MYRRVRHASGPKGVVLADEMGLGKTVQVISLLLALLKKSGALSCFSGTFWLFSGRVEKFFRVVQQQQHIADCSLQK